MLIHLTLIFLTLISCLLKKMLSLREKGAHRVLYVKLYDGKDMDERVEKTGAYFQHHWNITSYLDTKLGVRNEDVTIWVGNSQRRIPSTF